MAHALEEHEPRARDRRGERLAVGGREQRIVGPVEDERRRTDLAESRPQRLAALEQGVVLRARLVCPPCGRRPSRRARASRPRRTGASPRRRGRPRRGSRRPRPGRTSRARAAARRTATAAGRTAAGAPARRPLSRSASARRPGRGGRARAAARSRRPSRRPRGAPARRRGRRARRRRPRPGPSRRRTARPAGRRPTARVAEVVADHEARAGREARAELVLPPVHRHRHAADQQERRIRRRPERLDAELDAVGGDRPRPRGHDATR